ncbi:uncharacterized protein PHALS_07327 [Plasmopara halstedii]|uniref:Uncharacterized protein n=1 Tax=Plasmopara halstedii TaxID=4781 RepID=A0A0P1B481_PLAHL|nr:uncharacterized protein PHALS_07327 [Plasmopara halstedii]CEG49569.1 hypothetical protein PHALS_07327 [Plasmopara halstedii]|eukprot:XP_024585938.1 hypothetical protein PHALS_07327 [Plasmopara halstedii]
MSHFTFPPVRPAKSVPVNLKFLRKLQDKIQHCSGSKYTVCDQETGFDTHETKAEVYTYIKTTMELIAVAVELQPRSTSIAVVA